MCCVAVYIYIYIAYAYLFVIAIAPIDVLMLGCITAAYLNKFIATHVRNDLIKKLLFAKVGYERR